MYSELADYVGKKYTFGDGATITIIQLKMRDNGHAVTYETCHGDALPRRLVLGEGEFIELFGHLFTQDMDTE